jgi:hypothetical protein
MKSEAKPPAAYRWLVRIAIALGAITFAGGILWLWGGALMYGSPITGAFSGRLIGNYWEFWILWVVIAGPIALLPYALLERYFPRLGAIAMIVAAIFVAEAGIRSGRNYWGYAGGDALVVIVLITTPILLLGLSLLWLGARPIRWQAVTIAAFAMILLYLGIGVRYKLVKDYWDANSPAKMNVPLPGALRR